MSAEADRIVQAEMDAATEHVRERQAAADAIGGVCDFCCTPFSEVDRVTTWATDGAITGAMAGLIETEHGVGAGTAGLYWDPFWAACPACSDAVRDGTPETLADHALANRHPAEVAATPIRDTAEARADLVALYTEFYARSPRVLEVVAR